MHVGECGLLQISWECTGVRTCMCIQISASSMCPAAAFHLQLHSVGGLHIFDHASRPAVDTVAGCSSQRNWSQHCKRLITELALY